MRTFFPSVLIWIGALCAAAAPQEPVPSVRYAACRAADGVDARVDEICELADDLVEQLTVWDAARHPRDHSRVQTALGAALFVVGQAGDDEAAYRGAIAAYRAASQQYTGRNTRAHWAGLQLSMGGAMLGLARLGDLDALDQARGTFSAGLEAISRVRQPELWGALNASMAETYVVQWRRGGNRESLVQAVAALQAALEIYRRPRYADHREAAEARLEQLLEALAGEGIES